MTIKRSKIHALVLTGDGINCEVETAMAFKDLGIEADIIHISDLIERPQVLNSSHILVLPGGFSFGDEIGSGQILALKLKYSLSSELKRFIDDKKLIIGICNGFQALVRMGLLPVPFSERTMTLTHNKQGHFMNQWVDLVVPNSKCAWTTELSCQKITLPIRHGEGRVVFKGNSLDQSKIFETLKEKGQLALFYENDVNGSYEKIAGVCDPSGRVFGLMPHPEGAVSLWQSPSGSDKRDGAGIGALIFESGIKYCENNF
ncbi:MAG: phosphoribosylformylglycinamidine synthase subunit PurQ [Bdellovibrionales bacterium]|nr:phosphoribosylformylglycinamidine synthase subunit PurQ [Bdellovibrionales bacterium]